MYYQLEERTYQRDYQILKLFSGEIFGTLVDKKTLDLFSILQTNYLTANIINYFLNCSSLDF